MKYIIGLRVVGTFAPSVPALGVLSACGDEAASLSHGLHRRLVLRRASHMIALANRHIAAQDILDELLVMSLEKPHLIKGLGVVSCHD